MAISPIAYGPPIVTGGGAGGAPVDATYVTRTADATLTAETALSALATGILKSTTGTGTLSIAAAADIPLANTGPGAGPYGGGANYINSITLDAQGRVTAATTGTPAGGSGAPTGATYWTATADATLSAEYSISALADGIVKHASGVPARAVPGTDYVAPSGTAAVTIDGTGLASTDMLLIKNGRTASGAVVQVTGSVPSGFVLADSGGTKRGGLGYAVAANDWITGTAAGDVVVVNQSAAASTGVKIKAAGSGGVRLISPAGGGTIWTDDTGTQMGYGSSYVNVVNNSMSFTAPTSAAFLIGGAYAVIIKPSLVAGTVTAAGSLTLSSTDHATKGKLYLNEAHTAVLDEATLRLGVGTGSPTERLHIAGGIALLAGDGTYVMDLPADATGNVSVASGRVPVRVGGALKYLRYYDS